MVTAEESQESSPSPSTESTRTEVRQTLWTRGVTVATIDRSTALLDMSARGLERRRQGLAALLRHHRRVGSHVEAIARIASEQSRTH